MAMTPERREYIRLINRGPACDLNAANHVRELLDEVDRLQAALAAESHSPKNIEAAVKRARRQRTRGQGRSERG
jgi:hypothetical protein